MASCHALWRNVDAAHPAHPADGAFADRFATLYEEMDRVLGTIRARVPRDATLIVMSDHGPESRLNWFDPQPGPIRERLRNFFAARTPGHPNLFPADVTPVNVLPILFDAYLDADLPLHPDDSFFKMPGKGLVPIDVDD